MNYRKRLDKEGYYCKGKLNKTDSYVIADVLYLDGKAFKEKHHIWVCEKCQNERTKPSDGNGIYMCYRSKGEDKFIYKNNVVRQINNKESK